ncbi:MAG TPA: GNAT family N-acetyltransferase, partial [Candidatus Limnocylindrales bacterium]
VLLRPFGLPELEDHAAPRSSNGQGLAMGGDFALDDDLAWLLQHADVLFDIDAEGRLTRVNEPDPEGGPPVVFVARGRRATLARFRDDVPAEVSSRLGAIARELPAWDGGHGDLADYEPLLAAVREWAVNRGDEVSHGPAFRFVDSASAPQPARDDLLLVVASNAHLLDRHFPYTRSVLASRSPVTGIVRDGAIVSACYCARRRPTACEAGVATAEDYRGAGLAVPVVAAWAEAARAAGMTPLYSTTWDNEASLRVAAKLGLDAYADTLSLG